MNLELLALLLGGGLILAFVIGSDEGDEDGSGEESPEPISLTAEDDAWYGGDEGLADQNVRIEAGAGTDLVLTGAGDDILYGGDSTILQEGNFDIDQFEVLLAGEGEDTVFGGLGTDHVSGGPGDDTLYGGADRDNVTDEFGDEEAIKARFSGEVSPLDYSPQTSFDDDDILYGGSGNDQVVSLNGSDTLFGNSGSDGIFAHEAQITTGGAVSGDPGADTLYGGNGDDHLYGQNGDTMFGGTGLDVFHVFDSRSDVEPIQGDPVIIMDFEADEERLRVFDINPDQGDPLYGTDVSLSARSVEDGVMIELSGTMDGVETQYDMAILEGVTADEANTAITEGRIDFAVSNN